MAVAVRASNIDVRANRERVIERVAPVERAAAPESVESEGLRVGILVLELDRNRKRDPEWVVAPRLARHGVVGIPSRLQVVLAFISDASDQLCLTGNIRVPEIIRNRDSTGLRYNTKWLY